MAKRTVLFFILIILLLFGCPPGYCEAYKTNKDTVFVHNGASLKRILKRKNKVFVIQFDHDLLGKTIKVGKNSALFFDGGRFQNGSIIGKGTQITYSQPFYGENLDVRDCTIDHKGFIKDVDVFTFVRHNPKEIQCLFDLSGGHPISFSKGIYHDVNPVIIKNNIEADFNNSTIYANVLNKKSSTIFSRGIECRNEPLEYVHIKNVAINGGIDKNELRQKLPENRPSPCIELFWVYDVILDNVDITQFNPGTEDLKYMTPSYRDMYENYLVALMYGVRAKVTNCDISYCVNEGFKFAPAIDPDNHIEFSNNSSKYRYWTLLEVDDGRCLVKDNLVEGASSSAFNLFCYDSEVCNNTFRNSIRGCAIDLSEPASGGGAYRSYNVSIHDNKCYNYPQLLEMWAGNVEVYNNYIDGIIIQKANSAGCIIRMLNKYIEPNERCFKAPYNNPGGQEDCTKEILIHDNIFDGEFKSGIVLGNRLSTRLEGNDLIIMNNQYLDTKGKKPDYYPASFFNVKNIVFDNNTINVLKSGTYQSSSDNVYFYCDGCSGFLRAENNKVTKEIEIEKRYVFSIANSRFDNAIIIDASRHGFVLRYNPSYYSQEKNTSITTNCEPFSGIKVGRELQLIKTR